MISFENPWRFAYPEQFPTIFFWTRQGFAVAPFWSDNDIRREGAVRYATYCNISDPQCTTSEIGQQLLDDVNRYFQGRQQEGETRFVGEWLLIAHWDHVPPSPHGDNDFQRFSEDELNKVIIILLHACMV